MTDLGLGDDWNGILPVKMNDSTIGVHMIVAGKSVAMVEYNAVQLDGLLKAMSSARDELATRFRVYGAGAGGCRPHLHAGGGSSQAGAGEPAYAFAGGSAAMGTSGGTGAGGVIPRLKMPE